MGVEERKDGWKKREERRGIMFAWRKKSVSTLPTFSTWRDDSSDALVCSINTWPSEREKETEREREVKKHTHKSHLLMNKEPED